jgi:dTDP-4-dehydrorhamnose reductase
VGTAQAKDLISLRWVIVGSEGMLGRDLCEELEAKNVLALSKSDCDITSRDQVKNVIYEHDVVINCAAYTAVDYAENNPELTFEINANGPKNLASVCKEKNAKLVQISTDYVFSGNASVPYRESDPTNPKSVYGKSKEAGEKFVQQILPENYYIFRTAWLYGKHGKNFGKTILELEKTKDFLNVVNDQVGQPTWTTDLAKKIIEVVERGCSTGIYHGTSTGQVSWFEYAKKIFQLANLDTNRIKPISSAEFVRPAERPSYSVLGHDSFLRTGISPIRNWETALSQAFKEGVFDVEG